MAYEPFREPLRQLIGEAVGIGVADEIALVGDLLTFHRGEDIRRNLSRTDRELNLPALINARRGR